MNFTRREFLQGLSTASLLGSTTTLPGFLARVAHAAKPSLTDPILVVVQMTGGNDGLNTVVPYQDDIYHRQRPTLRIRDDRVLKLDDHLGLHPEMPGLKALFDEGLVGIINNVGYPNPDRSHFKSMDIWHTADVALETDRGWLGQVVDTMHVSSDNPIALHLDNTSLPMALYAESHAVPSIRDISAFKLEGRTDELEAMIAAQREDASNDLQFIQRVGISACKQAQQLSAISSPKHENAQYPRFKLAQHLRQIAQLIFAGYGARIYYTSIDGFDTHARQGLAHGPLLRQFSDSIAAFYKDLAAAGLSEQVTTLTFSEFGRRVKENGSRGTDHGAAAPMFLIGGATQGGIYGKPPQLSQLVQGDVQHDVDFRQVYSEVLKHCLNVAPHKILGKHYESLNVLEV